MNFRSNSINVSRAIFLDIDGVFHPAKDIESLDQNLPLDVLTKNHKLLRWLPILAEQLRISDPEIQQAVAKWLVATVPARPVTDQKSVDTFVASERLSNATGLMENNRISTCQQTEVIQD